MNALARLMEHVVTGPPTACWEWTGPRNKHRGNRPTWGRRNASRSLWLLMNDSSADGLHIEHLCENRHCVNPAHLRAVDPNVNYARLRRSHCKHGHELTDENRLKAGEYAPGKFRWKCRACQVRRERDRTERRRAANVGGQQSSVEAARGSVVP